MSENTKTNMTVAMSSENAQNTKDHVAQAEKTVYATETRAEPGWYDKIKHFRPENGDIPAETIQEIEEEDAPLKTKLAALLKIIARKNRDSLEQWDALVKETSNNESLAFQVDVQAEQIARLQEEREQQKKDKDEIMKSLEDVKRQVAAKENFLQTAENSNRRLSEDLTEKMNTLGTTGKDKKSLTRQVKSQEKQIGKLEEVVEHLKKEVATKGSLVEKYEGERGQWAKELVEQKGPLFRENKELKARVKFLEGELSSSLQSVRDSGAELSSSQKTLHFTRAPTPGEEPSVLADEIKGEEFEGESGGEEEEEVGTIDFQPPGWDRPSGAMLTFGGMAKGKPNPDRPALLHQPSSPSSSSFWSEGVTTDLGFSIPKALSSVTTGDREKVVKGSQDAGVQTEAAGSTVSSSAQTVGLEVLEASVQTEDWQSGPSADGTKAPVQTGETAVAPGAEWQRWLVVIMMLAWAVVILLGHKEDREMWLEANEVSRDVLVELRDSTLGAIPWFQVVSYNLIIWLQLDRVFLG